MAVKILWIDDEIEMLEPHIIFLKNKGYEVSGINNAADALELIPKGNYQAVLLDENMPGIGGLEALQKIKEIDVRLPVVMVTKNEAEDIMEEAIGEQIADYILKPVNPNQVLLSLKKILKSEEIIEKKTVLNYQQEFRKISMDLMYAQSYEDWVQIYLKLIQWDLKFDKLSDLEMSHILQNQKEEANNLFSKFIENNYHDWLHSDQKPVMSHTAFKEVIRPVISENKKVLLLMIDNLRYDQWKTIEPLFTKYFSSAKEKSYFSILPSATQYARNSFFAGLMPLEIEKKYPEYWIGENDEGHKNQYENELLSMQLQRLGLKGIRNKYFKILNAEFERKIYEEFKSHSSNADFITIVYNFIDILSHAKTNNNIVNELIRDDKTFRSLTYTWFENSSILKIIQLAAEDGFKVVITTDHGTIYVKKPSRVIGDKESSTNLRYKLGKNLQFEDKDVFVVNNPESYYLPKVNVNSKYIFVKENKFFAYPKNYNHFVNYYKDTYQHGGISMEEMIIPITILE
ncbi:PglZ domain-containing protein [Apibacter raozihei]|uniref:T9SS response regulator signal transducer PorX n=1 Tax=Apibacter raozihei TaxID=2500547 RepID=UPI000FE2BDEC|nr:PglZ domain-containing protein [Apibacter raozihei]